jgi:hypothetical protein
MKQSSVLFSVFLVLLLLVGEQAVEVVNANPYTFPTRTSPPDAAVVSIKVLSPKENATYTNESINVCFTKEINSLPGIYTYVHIISSYQGDWMNSSKWCPFSPGADADHADSFQVLQHNFTLAQVPEGYHTLTIDAFGIGRYNVNGTAYNFDIQKKVDVHFYIDSKDNQTSSPATINPTPSIPELPIAAVISVLAVASVSLVFLKRRRLKTVKPKDSKSEQEKVARRFSTSNLVE